MYEKNGEEGKPLFDGASINRNSLKDISDNKKFCLTTYTVLAVVSYVMTALNVITDKGLLTVCTGAFSALCVINIILTLVGSVSSVIAKFLFAVEVVCMFTFFLISGNPDGFSAIWICMLPSLGMLFFNRIRGTVLCAFMFAVLAFFLWTPYGSQYLMYPYNNTFKMRFPLLFVAFHLLAFLLETLRAKAYKEMHRLQEYYHDLSGRDLLTELYNRQGMYSELESNEKYKTAKRFGVIMFDVDDFKHVNDKYGHGVGDLVLKEFAAMLKEKFDLLICRWGGEEFIMIYADSSLSEADFEEFKYEVSQKTFYAGEAFNITISAGFCEAPKFVPEDIDLMIQKADEALYIAKSNGKNRIVNYKTRFSDRI